MKHTTAVLSGLIAAVIIFASSVYAPGMSPPVYTDKVIGPASSTDNAVMLFDGTTGKLAKDSYITVVEGAGTKQITVSADATDDDINFDLDADAAADTVLFRLLANAAVQGFMGYYGAGPLLLFHGEDASGANASIALSIKSGDTAGGASGALTIQTGAIPSGAGNSGVAGWQTGDVDSGDSGGAQIISGDSVSGDSGVILIKSGDAGVDSGTITLQTGTAGGARGDLFLRAPQITFDGGLTFDRTAVADAGHTAANGEYIIAYTSLSATRTVALPTAVGRTGQAFLVKDESGNAAPGVKITIDPDGIETIDGVATIDIVTPYGAIEAYSSGAAWFTK